MKRTLSLASAAVALSMIAGGAIAFERVVPLQAELLKPVPNVQVFKAPTPVLQAKPKFPLCPEGWVVATPPLNPQLGCLPNTLTIGQ